MSNSQKLHKHYRKILEFRFCKCAYFFVVASEVGVAMTKKDSPPQNYKIVAEGAREGFLSY
ncbi:hypothetical protein [Helicobacter sp. T3_23-1056]